MDGEGVRRRQRRRDITDPQLEQRPEVEIPSSLEIANGKRAAATATWNGWLRGDFFGGSSVSGSGTAARFRLGGLGSRDPRNGANLEAGSSLQHGCSPRVEKAVEGVRNPEDGTGRALGMGSPKRSGFVSGAGVDTRGEACRRRGNARDGASRTAGGTPRRLDGSHGARERAGGQASARPRRVLREDAAKRHDVRVRPEHRRLGRFGSPSSRRLMTARGGDKVMERVYVVPLGTNRRGACGNASKVGPVTGEGQGGSGEGQRPATVRSKGTQPPACSKATRPRTARCGARLRTARPGAGVAAHAAAASERLRQLAADSTHPTDEPLHRA